MTREQKLFEAARAMCDGFTTKEFKHFLSVARCGPLETLMHLTNFENLNKAVNAFEGVAFSDGGEK